MPHDKQMRTFIYKRTHEGDPDPTSRVFGNDDCMGGDRGWQFDAVIGIGGVGRDPKCNGIAHKLTWVGIGATFFDQRETGEACAMPDREPLRGPLVTFDDFWYYGVHGPLLDEEYQALARRMYKNKHVRAIIHSPSALGEPDDIEISKLDRDVKKILERAKAESRSGQPANWDFQNTHIKCPSNSCRG
jgi:hypothetical protein